MKTIDGKSYREVRCSGCRGLICYEYVFSGRLAIDKCPKCGKKTVLTFKHIKTKENEQVIKAEFTGM